MNIFAICDSEPGYAKKLAERITNEECIPGQVQVFDSVEAVFEFTKKQMIDAILLSEKFIQADTEDILVNLARSGIDKIFILSSKKVMSGNIAGYRCFYKYQPASMLVKEILKAYEIVSAHEKYCNANLSEEVEVIGVFAPVNSVEKTLWSLLSGLLLSKERPVLYISMERYAGFDALFGRQHFEDLADLFYVLLQEKDNVGEKVKTLIEHYKGLYYIPPIRFAEEFCGVKSDVLIDCINKLIELMRRGELSGKTIIVDFSGSTEAHMKLCKMCDRLFLVQRNDCMTKTTIMQFKKECGILSEDILGKVREVVVGVVKEQQLGERFLELNMESEWGISIEQVLQREGLFDRGA